MAEEKKQDIGSLIDGLRLLDDNLMTMVFNKNIVATQCMLNIILERADLMVKKVTVQEIEKSPLYNGRDVKLDILAEDAGGNRYDVEVQREDAGAAKERARFNSAAVDHSMLQHSQEFTKIKDSYVIFITENDVLKKGRALSHIDRTIREDNELWNDGNHIIYANAAYPDTTSDIGKLMHDFRCRNSEDMFLRPLRDSVHHFKETEGGRAEMSKDIERYGDERAIEATIKALRTVGQTDSQIESYLVKNYGLTKEDAEKYLDPVLV